VTVVPISKMIVASGYEAAFLWFGIGQGVICVALALFLAAPGRGEVPEVAKVALARRQYTWSEMIRTPTFWIMYVMFVMMAAGGLMATAQIGPIAKDFNIAGTPVTLIGLTLPALTFALSIDRVLNGLTRPFFGWVSDHLGRENTMFIAFALEAVGIWAMSVWGNDPVMFVILTGLVFFAWGEIYSLFPANLRRQLRDQVRGDQCRAALHRERHGVAAGALRQCPDRMDRQLARRVHDRQRAQRDRSRAGAVRAEAPARRA